MITKLTLGLRRIVCVVLMFIGLPVVLLGVSIMKLGAWLSGYTVPLKTGEDITDDELAQILREYQESKGDKE